MKLIDQDDVYEQCGHKIEVSLTPHTLPLPSSISPPLKHPMLFHISAPRVKRGVLVEWPGHCAPALPNQRISPSGFWSAGCANFECPGWRAKEDLLEGSAVVIFAYGLSGSGPPPHHTQCPFSVRHQCAPPPGALMGRRRLPAECPPPSPPRLHLKWPESPHTLSHGPNHPGCPPQARRTQSSAATMSSECLTVHTANMDCHPTRWP